MRARVRHDGTASNPTVQTGAKLNTLVDYPEQGTLQFAKRASRWSNDPDITIGLWHGKFGIVPCWIGREIGDDVDVHAQDTPRGVGEC